MNTVMRPKNLRTFIDYCKPAMIVWTIANGLTKFSRCRRCTYILIHLISLLIQYAVTEVIGKDAEDY